MDKTVMPLAKKQILELQSSSVVTVYHKKNLKLSFRSYTVPSTIRDTTIAFLQQTSPTGVVSTTMTFAYGIAEETNTFGSIVIDDPVFVDVPSFELAAKVVIR
jgi:selenophosphate synthase